MEKIKCKLLAEKIESQIKEDMRGLSSPPSLAVILVGSDPASLLYVKKKQEKCEELGFFHRQITFDNNVTEDILLQEIDKLNKDSTVDGILVQLPLPPHIATNKILDEIAPEKDVDGFSINTAGKIFQNREDIIYPCTPAGILEVIKNEGIQVEGKRVTVIGRSLIVGKPIALMLLNENATVTMCHSKTKEKEIKKACKNSDIIIIAVGYPYLINKSFLKKNCFVIDVGINRIEDSTKEKGFRVVGDFDSRGCEDIEGKYTAVPGGVGVMTITMLMRNCLECAKRNREKHTSS